MNELNHYLKGLGCTNTQFSNPHGLHDLNHFTTARDICLIAKKALSIPIFRKIVSAASYIKPKTNKQGASTIRHTNPLFKEGKFRYPKAIGIKTGFHSQAKNNFVAAAEEEGRILIAALLGCPHREGRYEDAIRLFETAFGETQEKRSFFHSGDLFQQEIEGSKEVLCASLAEDMTIAYYPSEEPRPKAFLEWQLPSLPIQKGAKVGEIRLVDERGALLKRVDLCAREEVQGTWQFRLKRWMAALWN